MISSFSLKRRVTPMTSFLGTAAILAGCTIGVPADREGQRVSSGISSVTITSSAVLDSANPTVASETVEPTESVIENPLTDDIAGQLQLAVAETVSLYGGSAGIALSDGDMTVSAGDVSPAASWSTIKVPIAIAALREDPSQRENVVAAIQWSDNSAAQRLWESLGDPEQAGAATRNVLTEGGVQIPVNTVVTRDDFSSFGQTKWSVSDQARFAANVECIYGSEPVLEDMMMIDPSQSWGIGGLPQAQFKGGWGPEPDGSYTARQFGLTKDLTTGQTRAVEIIVRPEAGSFKDAQSMSNELISKVQSMLPQMPATSC